MVETEECLVDILRHADVDVMGGVVPIKLESEVFGAGPVGGDCVFSGESGNVVIGMFLANILDAKIVND
jgi:hypothetical protein